MTIIFWISISFLFLYIFSVKGCLNWFERRVQAMAEILDKKDAELKQEIDEIKISLGKHYRAHWEKEDFEDES